MTGTAWFLQCRWVEYCSCDPGCPCEAMTPPTRGHSSLAHFAFDNNGMAYSDETAQRRFSMDRAAVG